MADNFEDLYIKLRDKESRVLSLDEVKLLPETKSTNPNKNEWFLRKRTAERFSKYLRKNKVNSLLEIGCGNGWFTNYCNHSVEHVVGIDINQTELNQAKQAFPNIDFYYWDIFTEPPFDNKFDLVVLNAVIQYFPDFEITINRLKDFLNTKGEIHILDSPFYAKEEIAAAKKRTFKYYTKMSVPEMAEHYYHNSLDAVNDFETLYKPNRIKQLFKGEDSPFCWYRLRP